MQRYIRRKFKKTWDRVRCFVVYSVSGSDTLFPSARFALVDNFVKISDDLVYRFVLDVYSFKWLLVRYVFVDGFPYELDALCVGSVSQKLVDEIFNESDNDFKF